MRMVLDQYGVIHLLFHCILLFGSFVANCINVTSLSTLVF